MGKLIRNGISYTGGSSSSTTEVSPAGEEFGVVKSGGDVTINEGIITVNDNSHNHTIENVDGLEEAINDITSHIDATDIHVTSEEKSSWDEAKAHADSTHARTDATNVEKSNTNGNIKINGVETPVYTHPSGTNPHNTTKSDVGLGDVENKSSETIRREITSSNVTDALGYTPLNSSLKGTANGVAELDANGKVLASQLPSFVDDVLEYTSKDNFPASGETGKIYVDTSTNTTYRWGGSNYAEISSSIALGETSSTAYRGDRGKIAYDHSQSSHAPSNAEANQNAFSNIKVGATTIAADTKTDTLELVAGNNVTITPDATSDKITISATDTTYNSASTTADGLMSSTDKTKLDATNIAYGTCSTAADTAAKVVTISGNTNWKLAVGSIVVVKFTNTNTASNVTLNVNNTGAKSIWFNNAVFATNSSTVNGSAGRFTTYMYDGTYWVWIANGTDNNTTYSPATLGQGYGTCTTAEATTAKVVSLSSYALVTGGVVAVKFTYNVPAGATMNINSKGAKAIYYRGASITANVIKAGDTATFIYNGTQYHLLTVDRDVDTNTDTKVTQTAVTDNANYPLLLVPSGQTATTTTTACFDSGVTLNPSTNVINAHISGNAGTASELATARTIDGVSFDGSANITHYGTCSTAAATAAKVVACTGFTLATGATIKVRFTVTNTAASITLNVNNTGAKNIRYRNADITTSTAGYFAANRTYEFVYDGTYYQVVGDFDSNNYDRLRYSCAVKCGSTAIVAGNLIVGNNGVYQHLKLGQAFDITYPILYATQAIAANGTNTQTHKAIPMTITTTQSITLTAYKPVYIKGKLSGTMFKPISTAPLTQSVPTSVDGYQYILVGLAYSSTQMMLGVENLVYEYKNGTFGLYSSNTATATNLIDNEDDLMVNTISGYAVDALVVKEINNKFGGCWIDFTDADGNPTTEPYIHWYEEDGTEGIK